MVYKLNTVTKELCQFGKRLHYLRQNNLSKNLYCSVFFRFQPPCKHQCNIVHNLLNKVEKDRKSRCCYVLMQFQCHKGSKYKVRPKAESFCEKTHSMSRFDAYVSLNNILCGISFYMISITISLLLMFRKVIQEMHLDRTSC